MSKQVRRECAKCKGTGSVRSWGTNSSCPVCKGVGYVELANVVHAPVVTRHASDPDDLLRQAIGELDTVVIVGHTKEGHEFYASSVADGPNALWILQRGAYRLLGIVDKEPDE